jgi:hypothetical protein
MATLVELDGVRPTIGAGTSVQDNAVIHCAHELPTVVGENMIVGRAAMLEGCVVEDGAVVGMGRDRLQRARLAAGSVLAAAPCSPSAVRSAPGCSRRVCRPSKRSRFFSGAGLERDRRRRISDVPPPLT